MPKVLGARLWSAEFAVLLPSLVRYLGSSHPPSDKAMAIGCVAENFHQFEGAEPQHVAQIAPLALACLGEDDAACKQNGVFCLGIIGLYGGDAATAHVQQILSAIEPLLRAGDEEDAIVRDNAVGCLSRLAMRFGAALPLVSIVPAILAHLPLTTDEGENAPALRCLIRLASDEGARAHVGAHVPQVLAAIGSARAAAAAAGPGDSWFDATLAAELAAFGQWLCAQPQAREQLPAAILSLPPDRRPAALLALPEAELQGVLQGLPEGDRAPLFEAMRSLAAPY
jgi:hypothetical protein